LALARSVRNFESISPERRKGEQVVAIELKRFLLSRLHRVTVVMGDFGFAEWLLAPRILALGQAEILCLAT
jgi:hypothetical protein